MLTAQQQHHYDSSCRESGEGGSRMAKQEDPIIRTTIRLPLSLLNAAKHRGIDEGTSFQDVVIRALEQYLGKKGGR